MTKEFIGHIDTLVSESGMADLSQEQQLALPDILDQAVALTKAKGSTTATLAFLKDSEL